MSYLTILIIYATAMIALSIYVSRRSKNSSDFFVAGRGLGAGLIATTLLAANIGAGSTIGATGLGYRMGLAAWWWVGAAGIGSLILAFTIAPKIWRVARDHNLYTVGDYLEFRYDKRVRGLAAVLLWVGSLIIFAGQLIGGAALLNVVAGINKTLGYVIAAAVVTFYFAIGGLHTAVRVNVLQLAVKLLGFLLALFFLIAVSPQPSALNLPDSYFSFTDNGLATPLFYLATFTPAFIISPGIVQKVFAARDEKAARAGVGLNALGLLLFAVVPALLGIAAKSQFPALANSELALPTLLTQALPFWVGALLLAAIFAAELSAADAVLFMLTTSLSKDLYQAHLNPQADDQRLTQVARAVAIGCGVIGTLLAMWLETVYSALTIFYTLLTAALILPMIVGLYIKRVTARAALASMIASVSVTFAIHYLSNKQGYGGVPPAIFGMVVGAVVMALGTKAPHQSPP
ncbi:MAG: sodium:solute symporter family protein [Blastocatellia bacterium]|nr:sodium:solute symporter family protein [Blastocatellia bacterium]